jgi:hypothetical protein
MEEKDLTKMTVTKLREEAKKYTSIQGVHAMKKEELIKAIADARGEPIEIKKKPKKKKKKVLNVPEIKKKIKELKVKREEARKLKDKKTVDRLRKKIKIWKRQTRKFAKEVSEEAAAVSKKEGAA